MEQPRGLSYKKRRFKRPKVWDVSNVFSEFGTFHTLWKDISNVPHLPNVPNFGTFETSFLIGETSGPFGLIVQFFHLYECLLNQTLSFGFILQ